MRGVCYIGDRVTAAAMGLAGIEVVTPQPQGGEIWRSVAAARRRCALVIVDQDFAEMIGDQLESAVIEEPHPPLIIMPTFDRDAPPRLGSSRAARRALGLEQKDHPR